MEISDIGVVLGVRPHGEAHAIVDVFMRDRGRWAGLVYGGQGRAMQAVLQPGNSVRAQWKGRDADSLGHFTLELMVARAAAVMQDRLALAAMSAACAVAAAALPEREPQRLVFDGLEVLLGALEDADIWPALMARWEAGLLAELGFALTLDRCAATGARDNLIYVSPRSACAVSAEAGAPFQAKLLPLPAFLRGGMDASPSDMIDGLVTTGYFLETRVLHLSDKTLPPPRLSIMEMLRKRNALL